MTGQVSLQQKILQLILDESGAALSPEAIAEINHDPALTESVTQLVEAVNHRAASAPAVEAGQAEEILPTPDPGAPVIESAEASETPPPTEEAPITDEGAADPATDTASDDRPDQALTDPDDPATAREEAWETLEFCELTPPAPTPAAQALRPGQIPAPRAREPAAQQPVRPPLARVSIANARAGEPFSSPVTIALDNGLPAEVTAVEFPHDIGLRFDKAQQTLSGTPAQSGDFDLLVRWSCASHSEGESKLLFVVNPDPRSLWKVIEPPADAPYFKAHIDHKGITGAGVRIAAASRRGRSHEHAGTFRDDDFYINHSDESGWSVMIVADGAGSASNSREGSRIASLTAGNYLYEQFKGPRGIALKEQITRWDAEGQKSTVNAMLQYFKLAAKLAVNSIEQEAILSDQKAKSYSTTLLATLSVRVGEELFAAAFWLGDGAIAAYGPVGKVRVLGNPDSGEYAGQTRFLDNEAVDDPAFSGRISMGKWRDVSHLILMTDGVSDPRFETDNGLQNPAKWDALVAEISPCLSDEAHAPARLAEWLNFFSQGNHDDRTLVVSW